MNTKAKISANGTYVFDPEEVEQLDELSLTSMIAAIDPSQSPNEAQAAAPEHSTGAGDTTINALLAEPSELPHQTPKRAPVSMRPDAPETGDDLISPDVLFPDLTDRE
jgi:hypothetical protein